MGRASEAAQSSRLLSSSASGQVRSAQASSTYSHTTLDYRQVFAWNGLTGNPERPFEVAREAVTHDQAIEVFDFDARMEWATATGPVDHKLMAGFDYSDNATDWKGRYAEAPPLDFADPVHSTDFGPFHALSG